MKVGCWADQSVATMVAHWVDWMVDRWVVSSAEVKVASMVDQTVAY